MVKKVKVNLPKDIDAFADKASEVIAKVLINKLQPKEIEQLIEVLEDDCVNITW
ncbi:hypothetical protein [Clostridium botulinum]|uniref:hypothetical protein n=1 Tax=Clostridium botulinum TaxID=1491 RepID=UPI00249E9444|nr:hypothetical protein [Clostridium botulinum]MDU4596497.1 hypothetical protein [Clostridium sporogenes]WGZ48128.1 hypothetical protein HEQ52_18460 [Clostridium botulinum]